MGLLGIKYEIMQNHAGNYAIKFRSAVAELTSSLSLDCGMRSTCKLVFTGNKREGCSWLILYGKTETTWTKKRVVGSVFIPRRKQLVQRSV
jgi:hypothetical protein